MSLDKKVLPSLAATSLQATKGLSIGSAVNTLAGDCVSIRNGLINRNVPRYLPKLPGEEETLPQVNYRCNSLAIALKSSRCKIGTGYYNKDLTAINIDWINIAVCSKYDILDGKNFNLDGGGVQIAQVVAELKFSKANE
ncbi:MAG: hypothetical protein AB4040_19555 [Synechococcus sp.]